MKAPAWILPLFLGASLASIYFLPKAGAIAESAVRMDLPMMTGEWQLQHVPASAVEISTLADDTEFAKAICLRRRPGEWFEDGRPVPDRLDVAVVLSGHDLNNSIHRPERCMPAQGHNILSTTNVDLSLPNGRSFRANRLRSIQDVPLNEDGSKTAELSCVTYYFFVGHDEVLSDHLARTFVDMKDRLVYGMDQRWAYVSVSMWFGDLPWIKENAVTEKEADSKIREFLTRFATQQIDWDQISS